MVGSPPAPSAREREILRSFAERIDPWDAGAANNLGVLYFTRGMVDEAAAVITRALELDPRMTVAQRNLEIAYFTSGFYDRRVQELSERLAQAPGDREARWEYGRTCLVLGDVTRALDAFGELLRDQPDDVAVIRMVAVAEMKCGDLEAAERWLVHALEVAPDNPAVLYQRGEVAYHRGLNDVALQSIERAVALAPDDADAWFLLGFIRGDLGDHDGAMQARQRAQRLNPSLGRARANLSLERFDPRSWQRATEEKAARGVSTPAAGSPMPHYHLALAFRQKGYLAEAAREYAQSLARGEDPDLVLPAMAEVQLMRGEMEDAVRSYDLLLANAPGRARFWNERGVALHHLGRHADALASYERAVEADSGALAALNNLGVAAYHAGQVDRAGTAFTGVLTADPGFHRARLNLALLLGRRGENARALAAYRTVIEAVREHPVAWNGAGVVLSTLGRLSHARDAFSRAIEARPDYAEAHYNLGSVLSSLGDHEGALRATRRALELDSYYTTQKFELAVEFEFEHPDFVVAPEVPSALASVQDFAFEPSHLDAVFDQLADPAPADATVELLHAARQAAATGDRATAHALARQAIGEQPSADALLFQGELYLAEGLAGEAIERFRQVRMQDPGSVAAVDGEVRALVAAHREEDAAMLVAWLEGQGEPGADTLVAMARVHAASGATAAAMRAVTRACALAPGRLDIEGAAAALARDLGEHAMAIATYRRLVASGGPVDAFVELAHLLAAEGHRSEALSTLGAARARDPRHAGALLALTAMRRDAGEIDVALADLVAFLKAEPWQLDVLASLAETLAAGHRTHDARFAAERVLRFDPDHPAALFVLGALQAATYDFTGAVATWDRLLHVEPSSPYAHRAAREREGVWARREELVGGMADHAGGA